MSPSCLSSGYEEHSPGDEQRNDHPHVPQTPPIIGVPFCVSACVSDERTIITIVTIAHSLKAVAC